MTRKSVVKTKEEGRHVNSVRKKSRAAAGELILQFSPDVLRELSRLEAEVHDSRYFSRDALESLQELTAGKPPTCSLETALSVMVHVAMEATKHIEATGDEGAKNALVDLTVQLSGSGRKPPFTVVTLGKTR